MIPDISPKFSAVIFDLDGTLADTLDDISGSMNRVLKKHGYPERPVNDYKLLVGRGLDNLVSTALPEYARQKEIVENCLYEMVEDYDRNCLVKTHLYDGISEVLLELQNRGIKLAVFSNKAEPLTIKIVTALIRNIDFVSITGARQGLPKKPDPAGALQICALMKVSPAEVIYVGDSDVDMVTGSKAGMYPLGVSWGFRSTEELINNGAARIVKNPLEIPGLL